MALAQMPIKSSNAFLARSVVQPGWTPPSAEAYRSGFIFATASSAGLAIAVPLGAVRRAKLARVAASSKLAPWPRCVRLHAADGGSPNGSGEQKSSSWGSNPNPSEGKGERGAGSKRAGTAAGAPVSPSLAEQEAEEAREAAGERHIAELEGQLSNHVQAEDYSKAAAVRDELSSSWEDDEQVLVALQQLYDIFADRDAKRMAEIWLQASYVQCIHPKEPWTKGYEDVCGSWRRLFAGRPPREGRFDIDDVQIIVRGATATVFCTERFISSSARSLARGARRGLRNYKATNIFRKAGQQWLLIHRHVSSARDSEETSIDDRKPNINSGPSAAGHTVDLFGPPAPPSPRAAEGKGKLDTRFDDADDSNEENCDNSDGEQKGEFTLTDVAPRGGDNAAKETVRALRRLSQEKRLSTHARTFLMGEMIRSPGDSVPERAYQLLLDGIPEKEREVAWNDFANIVAAEAKRLDRSGHAR